MPVTPPVNFFSQPFAAAGDKSIISDSAPAAGRATLPAGFPPETSQPINAGGVAPNRLDFNGILYMLSAFAFWQQSGGLMTWRDTADYAPPAMVYDAGGLYWCKAENGPGTQAGAVKPSTDTDARHWEGFVTALSSMPGGASLGTPPGTIIAYYGKTAPAGYLACDGSTFSASQYPELYAAIGTTTLPDLRGRFIRGYDPQGVNDPQGASRAVGSVQQDAGREVSGAFIAMAGIGADQPQPTGSFYISNESSSFVGSASPVVLALRGYGLSSVNQWGMEHTAPEFRPGNVSFLYCIKF